MVIPVNRRPRGRTPMRASHADRERLVDRLKAAFVQGYLTQDELSQRVGQALAARTQGDLAALVCDIPVQPPARRPAPAGPRTPARRPAAHGLLLGGLAFLITGLLGVLSAELLDSPGMFVPAVLLIVAATVVAATGAARIKDAPPRSPRPPRTAD